MLKVVHKRTEKADRVKALEEQFVRNHYRKMRRKQERQSKGVLTNPHK